MVFPGRFFTRFVFVLACSASALAASAATDVRFSATLSPDLRDQTGLSQLSVDNLAVIDALVRQDEAASKFKDNSVDHTRFSQRRTDGERQISGLDHLNLQQTALLDALVSQRIAGINPSASTVPAYITSSSGSATGTAMKPTLANQKLDIHGEIGFTMGWSKGGSYTGSDLVLTYDDPAGRYGILVGYSESHGKGLGPWNYSGYGPYAGYGPFQGYGPYVAPFPVTH